MRPGNVAPTLKLATARLEFHSDRRLAQALHLVAVAALIFLCATTGWRTYVQGQASAAVLTELRRQNAALRVDRSRALVELELERSTRAALARQVAELNEKAYELEGRLDFFNAQSGRPGKTR
jgi:hypothetical protein